MKRYTKPPRRRKWWLLVLGAALLLAAMWRFLPQRWYTAEELGIPRLQSSLDADSDGTEDWADLVLGARGYIATDPHYKSKYYAGGYPDDGLGVCTDVIWQAFRAAGYELKDLVDTDIAENRDAYPFIQTQDRNIDFRRVETLDAFFRRHAQVLTNSFDDPAQWQGGDIVIFKNHIGVVSDRRNKDGVPYVIHHNSPHQASYEEDILEKRDDLVAHYRISE